MENGSRQHKERLFELFAQIGSALANPRRLELLDLLVQAPRTVEELAQEAHMSVANTSQHLQRLKQARLVVDTRAGQFVRYALADPAVARLWIELRQVADRQLAEVDAALERYRPRRREFPQISAEELIERQAQDAVVLIDVRPEVEYQASHLPGAVCLPEGQLEARMADLPRDKIIVAYCRGPYCVYADQALDVLASRGWQVARLEEGVAEWQAAGYPVER